ncbi:MAG: glycosyl transferase family 2, partial [Bacteroidota bacterium]
EILGIFGIRYLIMSLIFIPSMRRLKELDLFFWFPVMDLLLPLYYYLMTPSLFKNNTRTWK